MSWRESVTYVLASDRGASARPAQSEGLGQSAKTSAALSGPPQPSAKTSAAPGGRSCAAVSARSTPSGRVGSSSGPRGRSSRRVLVGQREGTRLFGDSGRSRGVYGERPRRGLSSPPSGRRAHVNRAQRLAPRRSALVADGIKKGAPARAPLV